MDPDAVVAMCPSNISDRSMSAARAASKSSSGACTEYLSPIGAEISSAIPSLTSPASSIAAMLLSSSS